MNPHSGDFRGCYTSRKLPHFDAPGTIQFITFRLADSLPSPILREMRKEVDRLPEGLQCTTYTRTRSRRVCARQPGSGAGRVPGESAQ